MSSWTKTYVANMKTHETSDGSDTTAVDFCMDSQNNLYWAMHDCYSTTYPNYTPFQAWRAGFREGVKMTLLDGVKVPPQEIKERIWWHNIHRLRMWSTVGAHEEHGLFAVYGARLGTHLTMLTEWDHKRVQDFDTFNGLWEQYKDSDPLDGSHGIGYHLQEKLNLPTSLLDKEQSKFFKRHYKQHRNLGPLVKEIDVIRKLEGW